MQLILGDIPDGGAVDSTPKRGDLVISDRNTPLPGRQWGTDCMATESDICAIFSISASTLYIIGGRGEAEKFVDELVESGNTIHQFETATKKTPKSPYKVMVTPRTIAYSYGIDFDEKLRWNKVVIVKNAANFRLRLSRK